MPTTPSGFWYPGTTDTINGLSGLFAQQASSAEQALNSRLKLDGVAKFINAAARDDAFSGIVPEEGTLTYNQSEGKYEKWNGTGWVEIIDDFPPVTGKTGSLTGISQNLTGSYYNTGTVLSFNQRANISVIIFALFVATQVSGSPADTLVRAKVQHRAKTGSTWGAYVDSTGTNANGYVPSAYSFDVSFMSIFIIPPSAAARDIELRGSAVQSIGTQARLDSVTLTAMSFSQTNNL